MHVSVTNLVTVYVGDKFAIFKINDRLKLEYLIKDGEPRMLLTSCDKSIITIFIVRHFE